MKILKANNVTGKKSKISFNKLMQELKNYNILNLSRKRVNYVLLNNEKIYTNICTYNRI